MCQRNVETIKHLRVSEGGTKLPSLNLNQTRNSRNFEEILYQKVLIRLEKKLQLIHVEKYFCVVFNPANRFLIIGRLSFQL